MSTAVGVASGFICTSGFILDRSDGRLAVFLPASFAVTNVFAQCTDVDPAQATSAQYGTVARHDGTGSAHVLSVAAGPVWTAPLRTPTRFVRLLFSSAPTITTTVSIVGVNVR